MKKIIFILFGLFVCCSSFADTKIYAGFSNFMDIYHTPNSNKLYEGIKNDFGGNLKLESKYEYFNEKISFVFNNTYYDIQNTTKINYSIFYLCSDFNFGTNTKYLDFGIGVNFGRYVFDWLKFYCDAKVGYVPINHISSYKDKQVFMSSLELKITMFDFLYFYAGMESTQSYKTLINYYPLHVKNKIGMKFEYFFDNIGVFCSIDYYCKHPEYSYNTKDTETNANKRLGTVGIVFKF